MRSYALPILFLALILQGSLLSFPLVFVFLTNMAIKGRKISILPLAFFLGLILDSLYLRTLGMTSIFFLVFLFGLFTYERKFEIDNLSFIFVSSFLGSMALFLVLGDSSVLTKSVLVAVFTVIISKLW